MAPSRNEREAREARDRLRRYTARQEIHGRQVTRRRRDNILSIIGVLVVAGLAGLTQYVYFTSGPGGAHSSASPSSSAAATASPSDTSTASPSASASAAADTNIGDIPSPSTADDRTWNGTLTINGIPLTITLDGKKAPQAVAVFLQEITQGYYPGKTCHRLVNSTTAQLLQCGSTTGTGADPNTFDFGPIENAPASGVYPAGTLAMARETDNAYSNGHQFFIVTAKTTLPNDSAGGYTVFGTVTSGLNSLITAVIKPGTADGSADGKPKVATTITAVTAK